MALVNYDTIVSDSIFKRAFRSLASIFHRSPSLVVNGKLDLSGLNIHEIVLPANVIIRSPGNIFVKSGRHIVVDSGHRNDDGKIWLNPDQPIFDSLEFDRYAYRKTHGITDLDDLYVEGQLELDFNKDSCKCQEQHV